MMIHQDYDFYQDIETVLAASLTLLSQSVDVNTLFFAVNDHTTNFVLKAFNRHKRLLGDGDQMPYADVLCKLVCESGQGTIVVNELKAHPLTKDHPVTKANGNGCFLGVPILFKGKNIGTLCAFDQKPYMFNQEQILLFNVFGLLISQSVALESGMIRDGLTGVYNRQFVSAFLKHQQENLKNMSVIFVDVDNFKTVNDTFGHEFGDKVLVSVCDTLGGFLAADHFLARVGGDEFIILMPNVQEPARQKTNALVTEIRNCFAGNALTVLGEKIKMTVSMGVSFYPADGLTMETLLKRADLTMYEVKASGKNNVRFYNQAQSAGF